ncbi:MAG TPA: hypothetical protein VGD65_23345 [Chryseosolibacter sp.]
MKHFAKYLIVPLLLAVSCGKDEFIPADRGTVYFPIRVGSSWIYNVNQTIYSEVNAPAESTFKLRLLVADSILNPEGTYTYKITRARQEPGSTAWSSVDTWSVRKSDREVIVTEGNISFKKLMFPVRAGLAWNGNQYNNLGEDVYAMSDYEGEVNFAGTTFENVIKVEQEFNEDFIVFLDEREELYARNIGLVRQSIKQLNYCSTENCIGQQKVKSGKVYVQELVSYER